jgi:hypothetical protein
MASPILITTSPVKVLNFNERRVSVLFENAGIVPIYIKKQIPNTAISIPSVTNYDLILHGGTAANDGLGGEEEINSAAEFWAVTNTSSANLSIMTTVRID